MIQNRPLNGYIKTHRRILCSPHFRSHIERYIFEDMLKEAAWDDYEIPTKSGPITLKRGQVIVNQRELASRVGKPRSWLKNLLIRWDKERLTHGQGHAKQFTIVTICNYDRFQDCRTSEKPTNGQHTDKDWTTYKEKENKEIINITPPTPPRGDQPDLDLQDKTKPPPENKKPKAVSLSENYRPSEEVFAALRKELNVEQAWLEGRLEGMIDYYNGRGKKTTLTPERWDKKFCTRCRSHHTQGWGLPEKKVEKTIREKIFG